MNVDKFISNIEKSLFLSRELLSDKECRALEKEYYIFETEKKLKKNAKKT